MKLRLLLFSLFLVVAPRAQTQTTFSSIAHVTSDPSGSCSVAVVLRLNTTNGKLWACIAGSWTLIASSSSVSGVLSFTGDTFLLSNSASTGVVTDTLVAAGAHKYWGNNTGSTTAPSYDSLVIADLPTGIPNANLLNSSVSVNSQTCTLGSTCTIPILTLLSATTPVVYNSSTGVISCPTCSTGTPTLFYQTLSANGTSLPQEAVLNLITGTGITVSCVDNSGATRTDCTPNLNTALPNGETATTQTAGDTTAKVATDSFVSTAVNNAFSGINPAVAAQAATTLASDTSSLTYNNGVGGIGATFTGATNTAITVDGFTFSSLGQRLLVKNDTQSPSGAFNGVYYVTQIQTSLLPPILTRALDYNQPSDINNTGAIPVVNGTVNQATSWLLTSAVNTVGTDPLTYIQFTINPNKITQTISSGTATLGTSAIASAACASVVTVTATGVATTDTISFTPNGSIKAVTGYVPLTTGGLTVNAYPTSGNVNFDVCNWSTLSITPGAVTLNWRVTR